ncbi:MAG: prepilin-type N-terminal cleavage/methylation domain-containing protein [Candidatus Omnitrophota bacterium]
MDRLKRSDEGFTLLELIIAIALLTVVLLSAANLLINFGKFSTNVVRSEASLMGTALGVFEEIVDKLTAANKVAINPETNIDSPAVSYPAGCLTDGSCIQIRVDENAAPTPSTYSDDTVYTYWQSGSALYKAVNSAGGSAIASDIYSLSFTRDATYKNKITVVLEARAASGSMGQTSKEKLETTVVLRLGSAI